MINERMCVTLSVVIYDLGSILTGMAVVHYKMFSFQCMMFIGATMLCDLMCNPHYLCMQIK